MRLGQLLLHLRESAGLTVPALAELSRVQKKYIIALENESYRDLPDPMYVRHFLKAIAQVLGTDPEPLMNTFRPPADDHPMRLAPSAPSRLAFIVPSRLLAQIGIGVLVFAVGLILTLQVRAIFTPPDLTVSAPPEDAALLAPVTVVSGATNRGASITINGERVIPDTSGAFSVEIDLHQGVNVIKIAAKKPRSSERVVYRQVFVEAPAATSTPQ